MTEREGLTVNGDPNDPRSPGVALAIIRMDWIPRDGVVWAAKYSSSGMRRFSTLGLGPASNPIAHRAPRWAVAPPDNYTPSSASQPISSSFVSSVQEDDARRDRARSAPTPHSGGRLAAGGDGRTKECCFSEKGGNKSSANRLAAWGNRARGQACYPERGAGNNNSSSNNSGVSRQRSVKLWRRFSADRLTSDKSSRSLGGGVLVVDAKIRRDGGRSGSPSRSSCPRADEGSRSPRLRARSAWGRQAKHVKREPDPEPEPPKALWGVMVARLPVTDSPPPSPSPTPATGPWSSPRTVSSMSNLLSEASSRPGSAASQASPTRTNLPPPALVSRTPSSRTTSPLSAATLRTSTEAGPASTTTATSPPTTTTTAADPGTSGTRRGATSSTSRPAVAPQSPAVRPGSSSSATMEEELASPRPRSSLDKPQSASSWKVTQQYEFPSSHEEDTCVTAARATESAVEGPLLHGLELCPAAGKEGPGGGGEEGVEEAGEPETSATSDDGRPASTLTSASGSNARGAGVSLTLIEERERRFADGRTSSAVTQNSVSVSTPKGNKSSLTSHFPAFSNEVWYQKGRKILAAQKAEQESTPGNDPAEELDPEFILQRLIRPTASSRSRQVTHWPASSYAHSSGAAAAHQQARKTGHSTAMAPPSHRPNRFKGTRSVTANELQEIVNRLSACDPANVPDSGISRSRGKGLGGGGRSSSGGDTATCAWVGPVAGSGRAKVRPGLYVTGIAEELMRRSHYYKV